VQITFQPQESAQDRRSATFELKWATSGEGYLPAWPSCVTSTSHFGTTPKKWSVALTPQTIGLPEKFDTYSAHRPPTVLTHGLE
jgi:hypothetical protein